MEQCLSPHKIVTTREPDVMHTPTSQNSAGMQEDPEFGVILGYTGSIKASLSCKTLLPPKEENVSWEVVSKVLAYIRL